MEFDKTIYRVSLASKGSDGVLTATVTALPARLTNQLVVTANNRRLKLNQIGKMDVIATSDTLVINRVYTLNEQDIPALIEQLLERMKGHVASRLALLTKLNDGLNCEIVVRQRDWEQ